MATFVPRFLRQLKDVLIATPTDGQVLTYDSADQKWKNEAGGGGGVTDHGALTGLADDDHTQYVDLAPASSARNVIQPAAGSVIAAVVKAHAAQSVDIFRVSPASGSGLGYFRLGATGAVGIGNGTYDPAAYGPYLTGMVFSRATDGYYDAAGGPAFAPTTDHPITQFLIDGEFAPVVDQTTGQSYGLGGSMRVTGNKNFGGLRGDFYEVIHKGTKAAASGAQGYLIAGMRSAITDASSTGDISQMTGGWSVTQHEGSGTVGPIVAQQSTVELTSTSPITGEMVGEYINAIVWAATGTAVPDLAGLRVFAHTEGGRAVTVAKGVDIKNIGRTGTVTSYGLYIAAQTGATNIYGMYVAGGKSVFVDSLITGKIALPADADFANGQGAWWWDQANSLPKWKGKTSGATVVNLTPYFVSGADVALADGGTGASLTDPNADRILFWDDSAGAVTWLAPGTNLTITGTTLDAASTGAPTNATYITQTADAGLSAEQALSALATGIVKNTTTTGVLSIAVAGTDYAAVSHVHSGADITSGTVAEARIDSAIARDTEVATELADQKRVIELLVSDPNGSAITTGDGKAYCFIPALLNGHNLVAVAAAVTTVSSSGLPTVQIANVTDTVDMLSTKLTIDASEFTSFTAATPAVIDATKDDVATGDILRIDIDVAGTGAKGLMVALTFEAP